MTAEEFAADERKERLPIMTDVNDYNLWAIEMKWVLKKKGLFSLVDGSEAFDATAPEETRKSFRKREAYAMAVLAPSLTGSWKELALACQDPR